jgi:mono/diheme cytochrome c family protein
MAKKIRQGKTKEEIAAESADTRGWGHSHCISYPRVSALSAGRIVGSVCRALAFILCLLCLCHSASRHAAAADPLDFETDIAPIFKAKCHKCHGDSERKADLDLRSLASLLKGGESGPAITANDPEQSLLFEKVAGGEMPPAKKDRLTEAELEIIRRWIEAGPSTNPGEKQSAAVSQHDVIPILLRRCTVCHGARRQEAGLDLRTKASIVRGGKSGPAIVPGKPDESLLIKKIRAGEMPPITRLIEVSIKPIEPAETDVLVNWISHGAPEVDVPPDVATTSPDPLVTDKDREFWSFRPPQPVEPPIVKHGDRVRNPLDSFILDRLERKGLKFSPEAGRAALLRRVTFDLTGLPPEPADLQAFLVDSRSDAYERVVHRLLDSPRYGERWGRHWLDLAGYADSEGKREQDIPRHPAWRYRDYVINAFNSDKRYDRFLLEQIAGDELADYEHAAEITEEMYWNLVATGFLRMAPDPTWYNLTNFIPDRLDVVADEIDVFSSTVLGLTMKCARCHTHKFDPIPHRDYFRLVDIFKGAFDEHDWMKSNWHNGLSMGERSDRDLPYVSTAEHRAWQAHNDRLQSEIATQQAALEDQARTGTKKLQAERLAQVPEVLRADVEKMLDTPTDQRTAVQVYLAEKFEKTVLIGREELLKVDAGFKQLADDTGKRVAALESQKQPEPKIRALWDRGDPSPTYMYRRGDYLSPARLVGPGVPSMLTDGKTPFEVVPPWPGAKKTGRRLALAGWLTRPDHPLTARVMVNRIWKHHFGVGLVKSLDNFGKTGTPPTHPELLDWLARSFVESGWSIKAMHRLMLTSSTYRQSSAVTAELEAADPDNALYSRMTLGRLSADQLYDALLLVAGRLDATPFGPADPVDARADGLVTPRRTERGWRRSIYVQQQRKIVVTGLESFDFPLMNPNCSDRRDSTVVLQALHLMNNGVVAELANTFARRIETEAGGDPARQIERVYAVGLGRTADADELALGQSSLASLTEKWAKPDANGAGLDRAEAARKALATYCHAILNSAEFLYVD